MTFRGTFSRRNLKGNEKIKDGPRQNNVSHTPGPDNNNKKAQIITINGVEYFVRMAGGPLCDDTNLNQFNNKLVDVEGYFVGNMLYITSIVKV